MVMGKGGVGKTTIAAAIALGLVQRQVRAFEYDRSCGASGGDPQRRCAGISVGRDPKVETQKYVDKIVASRAPT
jgi:arsenite-transporting ATPase